MDVYIRKPKLLDDTAFSVFAGEGGAISPRKPQTDIQELKQKYSSLGDSVLSTENSGELADNMSVAEQGHNQPPKRLIIPTQFLEGDKGREKTTDVKVNWKAGKVARDGTSNSNGINIGSKNTSKDETFGESESFKSSGHSIDSNGNLDANENLNRPTSKLIQDNQNLQKLFDSVRGKESNAQESKNVGKLKLPATFKADERDERASEISNSKVKSTIDNDTKIKNAVAMSFEDWRNDRDTNNGKDETIDFHRANKIVDYRFEAGFKESNAKLGKQRTIHKNGASELLHAQVKDGVQNIWLNKQKQMQHENDGAGDKKNIAAKNKMYVDDMNLATSTHGDVNTHNSERWFKKKHNESESDKRSNTMNSLSNEDRFVNGIQKGDSMATSEVKEGSKLPLKNGDEQRFKTVGKLRLPTAFASNPEHTSTVNRKSTMRQTDMSERWETKKADESMIDLENNLECTQQGKSLVGNNYPVKDPAKDISGGHLIGKIQVNKNEATRTEISEKNFDKESKPVGRLDIKAIFHSDKEEQTMEKTNENSVIAKSKAIFDQDNNKKTHVKQRGVGKLRVGSSKSERYEEIDNLTPEGQLPSNISNQMKEQLEKILQGRSESVSSTASSSSSSSKRNDTKEVGRLSLSSISSLDTSLTSPRTNEDFSARSLDDDSFNIDADQNERESNLKAKVNNGSLESQLGNIFQRRSAGGSDSSSSAASSLNTSFNGGSTDTVSMNVKESKVEAEKNVRRKMVADAIKEKYGGKIENKEAKDQSSWENESVGNEQIEEQKANVEVKAYINESKPVDNRDQKTQPKRGKVSIPNIFDNKNGKEEGKMINKVAGKVNPAQNTTIARGLVQSQDIAGKDKQNIPSSDIKEVENHVRGNSTSISNDAKKVNIPETFLGQQNLNKQKVADGASKHDSMTSGKHVSRGNQNVKKVNFQIGVGIINEDGSAENVPAKQSNPGKLSLSLMQSFQSENAIRNRPGTPGRSDPAKAGGILKEGVKHESRASPMEEEKTWEKGISGEMSTKKFDKDEQPDPKLMQNPGNNERQKIYENEKSASMQSENNQQAKRTVGKLNIPAMFK